MIDPTAKAAATELLTFIDRNPSPWHAGHEIGQTLAHAGFSELQETADWSLEAGGKYFVLRDQSSIIAWIQGSKPAEQSGMRIIGAHTDSPGLRVKTQGAHEKSGLLRLGVDIYGGPILASFTDRDLSLAGRVLTRRGGSIADIESHLVRFRRPIARIPNLAIHLNRQVNEQGLKLNSHSELPLIAGQLKRGLEANEPFLWRLAEEAHVAVEQIFAFELQAFDSQPGVFWGLNDEFIADGQLDNLASCHAALEALLNVSDEQPEATTLLACFDHEEVGSHSHKGAGGSFLTDTLSRMLHSQQLSLSQQKRCFSQSWCFSADMAHALNPAYPQLHDEHHLLQINQGPALKINVNQRYATDGITEALFVGLCQEAGVPYQKYSHLNTLACGSTIGPIVASQLGVRTLDVGTPMWAMHSARESAGTLDHLAIIKLMTEFFRFR